MRKNLPREIFRDDEEYDAVEENFMRRRDFFQTLGAGLLIGPPAPATTVLFEDHVVPLTKTLADPANSRDTLWVRKADLPRINGFEVKPQGACRADVCIPIPKDMTHGEYFNLTAFAHKLSQSVVVDRDSRVW